LVGDFESRQVTLRQYLVANRGSPVASAGRYAGRWMDCLELVVLLASLVDKCVSGVALSLDDVSGVQDVVPRGAAPPSGLLIREYQCRGSTCARVPAHPAGSSGVQERLARCTT